MESVSIIIEHGKCSWGKCYFCGWGKRERKTDLEKLKEKYIRFLERNKGKDILKIFSSGSLLDFNQYPKDFVKFLIQKAKEYGFKEIIIESRPEFIKEETLKEIKEERIKITIAIGLEIADNEILLKYYNKGFTVEDYIKACEILRREGFGIRTYILVNGHPFLYHNKELQKELLEKTLCLALKYSDSIVVINAYPHENSNLILDWIEGRWKPLDEKEFYSLIEEVLSKFNAKRINRDLYFIDSKRIEIDFINFNFIPRIPKKLWTFIKGVGKHILVHPHFEIWQDFFVRFYKPPSEKSLLFIFTVFL